MFKIKKLNGVIAAAFVIASMCFGPAAFAQKKAASSQSTKTQSPATDEFSTTELQQFINANERAFAVQRATEEAMMAVIAEENISLDKFNEIAQAHQEQKVDQVQASEQDIAAFNKAAQRLVEMQPAMQNNLVKAIEQDGMTVEKFEKIMIAYQQDPALQAKVQKLLEK